MFIVGLVTMLFLGYWAGKYFGYWEGLCNRNPLVIKKCNDPTNHFCNVISHNIVCFEREGELWVKEYHGGNEEPEGRTYMVYHCPWCGFQTKKSKEHENVKLERRFNEVYEKTAKGRGLWP